MSTDFQEMIKEVAVKNRVGLERDDPIMVLVTIMNRIVEDAQTSLAAALEDSRTISEETALGWREDANKRANEILNAALNAGREAIGKGMSEGAAKVVVMIRNASAAMLEEQKAAMQKSMMDMKKWIYMLMGMLGLTVVAVIVLAAFIST